MLDEREKVHLTRYDNGAPGGILIRSPVENVTDCADTSQDQSLTLISSKIQCQSVLQRYAEC
jgi:hypothetical protein